MPDPAWKQTERRVAKIFETTRIALSGRNNMGKVGDVDLVGYATEVKQGLQIPKTVINWLTTLWMLAKPGEIPILVMQPKHLKERIVAISLTDFAMLVKRATTNDPVQAPVNGRCACGRNVTIANYGAYPSTPFCDGCAKPTKECRCEWMVPLA